MNAKPILLVEDHAPTAQAVIGTINDVYPSLNTDEGTLQWVKSASAATAALKAGEFAAVIIDDSFHEGEGRRNDTAGFELLKAIRSGACGEAHKKVPVLGACSYAESMENFEKAGATKCIDKDSGQGYLDFIKENELAEKGVASMAGVGRR